ncbi:hypothetical protein GCM10027082_16810 [Comamonas humi]
MPTAPPDLQAAFAQTHYHVLHGTPFTLRIGEPCAALVPWLRQHQTDCACVITAFNPMGQPASQADNIARHRRLQFALDTARYATLPTVAQHPDNGWPAEPGFLAIGMGREDALRWAQDWQQLAVVWCGADTVAELLYTKQ